MTPYQYTSTGIALDQIIASGTEYPMTGTVRNIEMFHRGSIYGEIDRDGQEWIVRLRRPGYWGIVGPKNQLDAIIQAFEETTLTDSERMQALEPCENFQLKKYRA
jgi:hypothetical protein